MRGVFLFFRLKIVVFPLALITRKISLPKENHVMSSTILIEMQITSLNLSLCKYGSHVPLFLFAMCILQENSLGDV